MARIASYDEVLAANITAARARRRLSQRDIAERMAALGFPWRQQIVAAAETRGRRVTVGEILGLALALETTIGNLMDSADDNLIGLPSGDLILARSVLRSVRHFNDGMVSWDGNQPRIATREPETWPETSVGRQLRDEVRALEEFGADSADMIERNRRLYPEPPGGWPLPGPPPRREDDS